MFQYAYIKALSLRTGQDFMIDIHEFQTYKLHKYCLEFLTIKKNYAKTSEIPRYERLYSTNRYIQFLLIKLRWICKAINPSHYTEKQFNFDQDFMDVVSWYIEWYFQTEKYFIDYEDEIRSDFVFVLPPSQKNWEMIQVIAWCNSVSIHIRRWDYLQGNNPNYHGICGLDYYHRAIDIITSKIDDPVFFVFSDDIERVKDNLKIDNAHYIDRNTAETNYEDMRLMSHCQHNIIANSSFSRWWAWLNNNPDKMVIVPQRWFADEKRNSKDIIPTTWVKI